MWNEGIQNHLTAAVPGRTDQFLIIAFGLLWNQVSLAFATKPCYLISIIGKLVTYCSSTICPTHGMHVVEHLMHALLFAVDVACSNAVTCAR